MQPLNFFWSTPSITICYFIHCISINTLPNQVKIIIYLNLLQHNLTIMALSTFTIKASSNLSMNMIKREKLTRQWTQTRVRLEKERNFLASFDDEWYCHEHQKWICTRNTVWVDDIFLKITSWSHDIEILLELNRVHGKEFACDMHGWTGYVITL